MGPGEQSSNRRPGGGAKATYPWRAKFATRRLAQRNARRRAIACATRAGAMPRAAHAPPCAHAQHVTQAISAIVGVEQPPQDLLGVLGWNLAVFVKRALHHLLIPQGHPQGHGPCKASNYTGNPKASDKRAAMSKDDCRQEPTFAEGVRAPN